MTGDNDPKYIPSVPAVIAEILETEKKHGRHYPFKASGSTRKAYDWYKYHYSRKMKYARLHGWTVESEDS